MRVQVVLRQDDLARAREVDIGEIAQDLGVVDGRATLEHHPIVRGRFCDRMIG